MVLNIKSVVPIKSSCGILHFISERSFHLEFLENCCLARCLCANLLWILFNRGRIKLF